jgi:hypothetical protein
MKSSVKSAVDWDRDSPTFGVRYISQEVSIPKELREFATVTSQTQHSDWKSKVSKGKSSVVDAAVAARLGRSLAELDLKIPQKSNDEAEL